MLCIRSDIIWVKTKYKSMPHQKPTKAWALLMDVHEVPQLKYLGKPVFLRGLPGAFVHVLLLKRVIAASIYNLYDILIA